MDFFRNRERCAICKKGKTKDISGGDGSLLALPLGSKLTATQFASSAGLQWRSRCCLFPLVSVEAGLAGRNCLSGTFMVILHNSCGND